MLKIGCTVIMLKTTDMGHLKSHQYSQFKEAMTNGILS